MLKQNLVGAAVATCLTNRKLHDKLREVLLQGIDLTTHTNEMAFHKECQVILCEALEREEPRRFRINEIEQVVRMLWSTKMFHGTNGNVIRFMDMLSEQLFQKTASIYHFRDASLDNYTRLAARIDPALLLCWRIIRDTDLSSPDGQNQIMTLVRSTRAFYAKEACIKIHADNHVHQGGAACEQLVLMQALRVSKVSSNLHSDTVGEKLKEIRALAHALLSGDGNLGDYEQISTMCMRVMSPLQYIQPYQLVDWPAVKAATTSVPNLDTQWFKHMLASAICEEDLSKAWLWFLLWCVRQYKDPACAPNRRIAIFLTLGTIMRVRRDMLVEGYGLKRFNKAAGNRSGEGVTQQLNADAARRIFAGPFDVAEIKVKINALEERAVRNWVDHVIQASNPDSNISRENVEQACARWHYCVMFSREKKNPWTLAGRIADKLRSESKWTDIGRDLPGKPSGYELHPARLIRSLDVSGDENLSKIEVFAPALRWLRSLKRRNSDQTPLLLSVHAGEDFAHPVSGMRHIDETVCFCNMQSGDRIGHGLALGIPPTQWFQEHCQAILPIDEYFDNVVWAWNFADKYPDLPNAEHVARAYASAAKRLAPYVGWINFPTPLKSMPDMATLHEAWKMRQNCADLFFKNVDDVAKRTEAVPNWIPLETHVSAEEHTRLFLQRIGWLSSLRKVDDYTKQNRNVEYTVQLTYSPSRTVPNLERHDALRLFTVEATPAEMVFLEALQDLLIENYRKLDLTFEINLTSNRYIGPLAELRMHPIFRWNPPDPNQLKLGPNTFNRFGLREGALRVCINTDDPGIMPTTLRTEFDLLRHAALELGYKPDYVRLWLSKLRKNGRAIFLSAHSDSRKKTL